jgi:pantoate kinase
MTDLVYDLATDTYVRVSTGERLDAQTLQSRTRPMNPTQQAAHKRTTDGLAHVIAETQGAVVERFEQVEASFAAMYDKVDHIEKDLRARVERVHVNAFDTTMVVTNEIADQFRAFTRRGFWGRLNWLLTGR